MSSRSPAPECGGGAEGGGSPSAEIPRSPVYVIRNEIAGLQLSLLIEICALLSHCGGAYVCGQVGGIT